MTSNEEYVGWKTHEWNLLPLQLSSWTHSPSLPVPRVQTLTESSLTDARYSPEGSQHTECIGFVCPYNHSTTFQIVKSATLEVQSIKKDNFQLLQEEHKITVETTKTINIQTPKLFGNIYNAITSIRLLQKLWLMFLFLDGAPVKLKTNKLPVLAQMQMQSSLEHHYKSCTVIVCIPCLD